MKKTKKIFIRADANRTIGTGHVMRCISVAKALRECKCEVTFVTADHEGDALIEQNSMQVVCINSDWSDLEKEINQFIRLINDEKPNLLIVDSYYVTQRYFDEISGVVPVVYIDDQNICKWNVDFLINYNIFSSVFDYSAYDYDHTKLLLGCGYAPLREEFRNIPERDFNDMSFNVMVSAGGSDPDRVTERIIERICPLFGDMTFHFIVGALNPRIKEIRLLAGENVILHINEKHMSELMQKCDVAIAAAGSTLYELCACGTPTIIYSLADNQLPAVEEFTRQGIMISVGDSRTNENFVEDIADKLRSLKEDKGIRIRLSRQMKSIVDGKGALRIAEDLLGYIVS